MTPDLVRRHSALVATQERFGRRAFELGTADCAQLARFHLRAMGHKRLPALGKYQSPKSAAAALKRVAKRVGAAEPTLAGVLDRLLERIVPAAMLPGDVAIVEQDGAGPYGGGALVVSVGEKFWCWHPDCEGLVAVQPKAMPFLAAWRA